MTKDEAVALLLAGKLAGEVRAMVGGVDLNGYYHEPCTIVNAFQKVTVVRNALDAYDQHIAKMNRSQNAPR